MEFAPYLLQAFAARMLAAREEAVVSRLDLVNQGYDVETLLEMIEAYNTLPDSARGFLVEATTLHIFIRRRPDTKIPVVPIQPLAPAKIQQAAEQSPPKPPTLMRALTSSRIAVQTPGEKPAARSPRVASGPPRIAL